MKKKARTLPRKVKNVIGSKIANPRAGFRTNLQDEKCFLQ